MHLTEIKKPQSINQLNYFFDVNSILSLVNSIDQNIWKEFNFRQKTFDVHKHTLSIPVLWVPLETEPFEVKFLSTIQTKHPKLYDVFVYKVNHLLEFLENTYNGKVYKIILVNLKPQGNIPLHVDGSFSLEYTHRVHIPVITNKLVEFTVNNVTINMKAGSLYEINNCLSHGVINKSNKDRIHIIIDIIENKTIDEISNYIN